MVYKVVKQKGAMMPFLQTVLLTFINQMMCLFFLEDKLLQNFSTGLFMGSVIITWICFGFFLYKRPDTLRTITEYYPLEDPEGMHPYPDRE